MNGVDVPASAALVKNFCVYPDPPPPAQASPAASQSPPAPPPPQISTTIYDHADDVATKLVLVPAKVVIEPRLTACPMQVLLTAKQPPPERLMPRVNVVVPEEPKVAAPVDPLNESAATEDVAVGVDVAK